MQLVPNNVTKYQISNDDVWYHNHQNTVSLRYSVLLSTANLLDFVVSYCLNFTIVRCIDCATFRDHVCFISVNTEA